MDFLDVGTEELMTTKTLTETKLPANPPGWKGNAYFISGKVDVGPAYGIALKPGKNYDFDVIFPVITEKPKIIPTAIEVSVQKPIVKQPRVRMVANFKGGRPKKITTPEQLTYLNSDLSIRQIAKITGISKSRVAMLRKSKC
jgi:hypothetical protein